MDTSMNKFFGTILAVTIASAAPSAFGWDPDDAAEQDAKAQAAIAAFKEKDPSGKGGIGIGGARGKGNLYEGGEVTANVTLTQLTIGFQWGGQAYSEFLFFEDAAALENFKRGNYELGAQASAVAVTAGASADANFVGGVAIFTQAKGGLMYEATVGGQKFKVELKE
jgi:hypothetical protein